MNNLNYDAGLCLEPRTSGRKLSNGSVRLRRVGGGGGGVVCLRADGRTEGRIPLAGTDSDSNIHGQPERPPARQQLVRSSVLLPLLLLLLPLVVLSTTG